MEYDSNQKIGRYQLEKKIGQGSMGYVYLGWDSRIHRHVAIKTLRMDRLDSDEERRNAQHLFLQEARIIGNLSHSHINGVFDMGIHDGAPYMVMEYVPGENIRTIIDQDIDFSLAEKIAIISMVARALHYAHQRGILHRDVKPANVMIHKKQSPKIMDFGIARIMKLATAGRVGNLVEEEGGILGTPHHMSPEQVRGEDLDHRTDIFSLGILAYEWFSGRKPFEGKNLKQLLMNIVEKTPESLSRISSVDGQLEAIINRALEKTPKNRYQSADEFSDALEMYIHSAEMESTQLITPLISSDRLKIIERLKKNYVFFADFSATELHELFQLAGREKFAKGEYLIREGTSGTKMFLITSGSVSIVNEVDGKEIEVETLDEGRCVGEMSIIDRLPRSASVIAREPTQAISINETVLRLSNPKLCLKLYRNLATMVSEKLRQNMSRYRELLTNLREMSRDI